ncbi:hypothetical protein FACS1894211_07570 [Clostridia bacterium]|nr:hypothetical protein FACS1894211_07570 [Clostridia bacterium]
MLIAMRMPIEPMLLARAPKPFDSPDYAFELKFDGVRMLAYCSGEVRLFNRRCHERTHVYTEVAADLRRIQRGAVLDGEIIAPNADGRPDFYRLLKRDRTADPSERLRRSIPVRYMVFDVLETDGQNLTALAYRERRGLLEELFAATGRSDGTESNGTGFACVDLTDVFPASGEALFQAACRENLEGIVAKRWDGEYRIGRRSDAWIKIKNPTYTRPK